MALAHTNHLWSLASTIDFALEDQVADREGSLDID